MEATYAMGCHPGTVFIDRIALQKRELGLYDDEAPPPSDSDNTDLDEEMEDQDDQQE